MTCKRLGHRLLRRSTRAPILLVLLALMLGSLAGWTPAHAQATIKTWEQRDFLHEGPQTTYLNHAEFPYRAFPIFGWEVPRYDRLGQYVMEGRVMLSADEQRPGLSKFEGLRFETGNVFQVGADFNYQVMQDSYRGRSYALMVLLSSSDVSTAPVKAQFTPLTLNMNRYTGVRFDVSGSKNKSTFLYTKGAGDRHRFSQFEVGRDDQAPVILWGGHWGTQVGSALRLGTTFINQHMLDATSRRGSILRGDISNDMQAPEVVVVRIVDDSPEIINTPAAAWDVGILVKGLDADGNRVILTSDPDLAVGDVRYESTLDPGLAVGRRVGDHWEADGPDEQIEFFFEFPDPETFQPTSAEFVAAVGGDYRLQVRQEYKHSFTRIIAGREREATVSHQWPAEPRKASFERSGFEFDGGDLRYPTDFKFGEQTPAYTVMRSDGIPRSLEPRQVRFEYGFPTAQVLASVDAHLDYGGFEVDGEVSLNTQHFKFPVREGRRTDKDALAYYVTASRALNMLGRFGPHLGLELFRIDADYSGNYDSRRGGAIFHTSVPASPPNTAITQEFNLFDDNDDGDQWPDEMPNDTALSGANDAGVYPGLDQNQDNVPDTDQNANGIPDWDEAFLFFWADPPAFIYDLDFNNNSVPDLTENDDRPDYPYDRGTRGNHAFLTWKDPLPFVEVLTLGSYGAESVAGGGDSDVRYLRYQLGYRPQDKGHMILRGDVKMVEDSIPDPVFVWRTTANARDNSNVIQDPTSYNLISLKDPDPDPMLMRNSTVSTLQFETDATPVPGLSVFTNYKWLLNMQHEDEFADSTSQQDETMSRLTLSTRLQYEHKVRGNIQLYARLRHLFWHDAGYSAATRRHWMTWGPLFEESMKLTEKTSLVAGQEGIPWLLPIAHTDYDDGGRDFDRWTNVFMVRMHGNYLGWKAVTELGYQIEHVEAPGTEASNRTFFLEMYFGF
ncbi:MAG: hypothetical protein HN712_14125 [Gemmatimonadetes bacterium]|nr:hypothetical protein [Gemmatimonadota bacterium]MBT7861455.1 hypothetical protein [Gemmatimonadota bacterium]